MPNQQSFITIDITHSPYMVEIGGSRRHVTYTSSYGRFQSTSSTNNVPSSIPIVARRQGATTMSSTARVVSTANSESHILVTSVGRRATAATSGTRAQATRASTTTVNNMSTTRASTAGLSSTRVSTSRASTAQVPATRSSSTRPPSSAGQARASTTRSSSTRAPSTITSVGQARASATRSSSRQAPSTVTSVGQVSGALENITMTRRILRGVRRISVSGSDEVHQPVILAENPKKNMAQKITQKRDSYIFGRLFCPVCFCDLLKPESEVQSILCGHVFCKSCIVKVQKNDGKCPTCRAHVHNYHPIYLPQYDD